MMRIKFLFLLASLCIIHINLANNANRNKLTIKRNEPLDNTETKNNMLNVDRLQDFSWLLSYKKEQSPIMLYKKRNSDNRLISLIQQSIPNKNWAKEIKDGMYEDWKELKVIDIKINSDRFAIPTGDYYRCRQTGLLWCDIKEKVSIIATGLRQIPLQQLRDPSHPIHITSRTTTYKKIPNQFMHSLKEWIKNEGIDYSRILFYDKIGIAHEIKIDIK